MVFDVVTLFPGLFSGVLQESILGRARRAGKVAVRLHDLRRWGIGKHRQVDDTPYGGGGGTVASGFDVISQGMEAYVAHLEATSGPMEPARKEWLLANDAEALVAARGAGMGLPDVDQLFPTMTMPCLLYVGEADGFFEGVRDCAPHIPNATFVSFPGLDHGQASRAGDQVLPHVIKFLKEGTAQISAAAPS